MKNFQQCEKLIFSCFFSIFKIRCWQ